MMKRCLIFLILTVLVSCDHRLGAFERPNVLLIFCDDLNDSVEGFGGHPQAITPNLERLASQGIRFTNAHSADPICGPSRASFLTGIYPHHSGLYGFNQNGNAWHNNPVLKNCKPVFEHFADNGYLIFGAGKLFHNNHGTKPLFERSDSLGEFGPGMEYGPFAWTGLHSENLYNELVAHPDIPEAFGKTGFTSFSSLDQIPVTVPDREKGSPGYRGWYLSDYPHGKPYRYEGPEDRDPLPDELTAEYAVRKLNQDHNSPFLLTVGIIRPHSPWHAPQEFFDLFPLDEITLPPYLNGDLDDCAEEIRYHYYWPDEHRFLTLLESYEGDEGWRRFLQAYLACVAFVDAQVGKILEALESSRYAENTIVVFTSDHGYHMGEKDQLFKHTLWEESTRVPMVIRLPGGKNKGKECPHPVGLIDIYPTLLDLCGLPDNTMRNPAGHPLDGFSMKPFLEDPRKGSWKGPGEALSCIDAGVPVGLNEPAKIEDQHFTIRSKEWRYVLTRNGSEELYDHRSDPHEWHNLAGDPGYGEVKNELRSELMRLTGRELLFDPADASLSRVKSAPGDLVTKEGGWVSVDFANGSGSSLIEFHPDKGVWDGSGYRFIRGEVENTGQLPLLVELGTGGYDLTQGATIVPPGEKKVVKAVIYRTEHPAYIDSLFPVMHGKPDGILRGWMATTCDSIPSIKLLFPELEPGSSARLGKIWLEEPYVLYSADELKKMYYPFVDSFGQFLYEEWPGKIGSVEQMKEIHDREDNEIVKSGPPPEWDRYGGWAGGPQLEATGRFRVEKVDGKWWFVDPDGRLFWSHGMDCVEFGTQTRTRVSGREHYFTYLPPKGSPEARLYQVTGTGEENTRWLSFHALNLFRIYGEDWEQVSNRRIHDRFAHWGMNTIGNWSDPGIYLRRRTPYVLTAYSKKTGLIADPYAPGFREELVSSLKARTEEIGDPWCLGVFIDNELKWGVKWAPKIPEQIMTAPADQPAKQAFVRWLTSKYTSLENLNGSWGTSFPDWTSILENKQLIPAAREDLREFMVPFTREYYSICRDAVREVDPEMLYMGCRMDFHLYPEDTSLNYIIRIASEYCDVVSFNRYRYTCSELVPPDGGDYPIIIGEFHFGSLETGLLQPGLRYAADPDERALFYEHYVNSALKNPYMVGTHWFQLVDQSVTGRPDGENYQAGFLTVGDSPQQEIVRVARETGRNMYEFRNSNKNKEK